MIYAERQKSGKWRCSLTCMTVHWFLPACQWLEVHSSIARRLYTQRRSLTHLYSTQQAWWTCHKCTWRCLTLEMWFRFDSIYQSVFGDWRSEPVRWSSTQTEKGICTRQNLLPGDPDLNHHMIVLALHPILRPKSFQRPRIALSPQNTRCHWGNRKNPVITPIIVKVTHP